MLDNLVMKWRVSQQKGSIPDTWIATKTQEQIEIQKVKEKQRILRSRLQHEEWINRRDEQKQKEKEMEKMKEQDPERNAMWRMDMSPMSEQ
ncbi:MAG: hypothetical protein EZS28_046534, partial [Streblomastix strix]